MAIPNELFSGYLIQYRILLIHFFSNILIRFSILEILADRLNASISGALRTWKYGIYRVIHKTLRDFRPLLYSNRDGHAEGEHVNRGRDTPSLSYLTGARYAQSW